MSELGDVIQDELDAMRPDRVPPFDVIRRRRRRQDGRRRLVLAGASVAAVALVVPVALGLSGDGRPDRLAVDVPPAASAPVDEQPAAGASDLHVPADPLAAEICRGSGGCRTVGEQSAHDLAAALATARPHAGGPQCTAMPVSYLVFFVPRDGLVDPVGYRVPSVCAPVEVAERQYDVDQSTRDLVVRLYAGAGRASPTDPEPVGATPYDETTAPAAFAQRPVLRDCGAVLDLHLAWPSAPTPNQEADSAVRQCWRTARQAGQGAEVRIVSPSADSGPVFSYLRTLPTGALEVWRSGKDRLMGREAPITWQRLSCEGVEPRNLEPTGCAPR